VDEHHAATSLASVANNRASTGSDAAGGTQLLYFVLYTMCNG
jgi:hypothetical protein